jgi:succinate dehydrogenase / fumarate reductase flavoprotein subunit
MNTLVGIIRKEEEVTEALDKLTELRERYKRVRIDGNRPFNPGWHLAIDLRNMMLVSECIAKAALTRTESRGGHTRDDHPSMESDWRKTLLVCRTDGDPEALVPDVSVTKQDQIPVRQDLLDLFELSELEKYFTDGELAEHPERSK